MLHDRHLLSNLVQIIQIYFCNAHIISLPALSNHAAPWIHDLQLDNNKEYKKSEDRVTMTASDAKDV